MHTYKRLVVVLLGCVIWWGNVCAQTPVIFDTDMGPDYDDVGAIALLHAFADSGKVEILGTVASNKYEPVAAVLNVFNTYFRRPGAAIGVPRGKAIDQRDTQHWTDSVLAKYPHGIRRNDEVPDAVELYRKLLADRADHSVVVITVGFLTNLSGLLQSGPDRYSSLGGAELVERKVKRLVCMAGSFPSGREFNIWRDADAARYAFAHWPTEIIFSGFEIGRKIKCGLPIVGNPGILNSPVKDVFRISIPLAAGDSAGRMSWDETAVLVGVVGAAPYYRLVPGRIVVAGDGSNVWDTNGKGQFYLVEDRPFGEVRDLIDRLMQHHPR